MILKSVFLSIPHPLALNGPESAQPGSEPVGDSHARRGPIRLSAAQRGAGWERSARRPAGGAAALRAAARASFQGQRGRGGRRRGSGWLSPAAPTFLLLWFPDTVWGVGAGVSQPAHPLVLSRFLELGVRVGDGGKEQTPGGLASLAL